MKLHVLATNRGATLSIATQSRGFIELASFIGQFRCSGVTARLLERNLDALRAAARAGAFRNMASGITIAEAIRVAARATKGARHVSVQSHPKIGGPLP